MEETSVKWIEVNKNNIWYGLIELLYKKNKYGKTRN
jgi:hypothetical protein